MIRARWRLPGAKTFTEPDVHANKELAVHASRFSLLRSCSCSVLGSEFTVPGSSFRLARLEMNRAIPTMAETIITNSGKNSKRRMLRAYRKAEPRTSNHEPRTTNYEPNMNTN